MQTVFHELDVTLTSRVVEAGEETIVHRDDIGDDLLTLPWGQEHRLRQLQDVVLPGFTVVQVDQGRVPDATPDATSEGEVAGESDELGLLGDLVRPEELGARLLVEHEVSVHASPVGDRDGRVPDEEQPHTVREHHEGLIGGEDLGPGEVRDGLRAVDLGEQLSTSCEATAADQIGARGVVGLADQGIVVRLVTPFANVCELGHGTFFLARFSDAVLSRIPTAAREGRYPAKSCPYDFPATGGGQFPSSSDLL